MISVEQLSGFGEALKELRWQARMKQVEVCRATGMTAPQVSRYENGHEMPTIESLFRYLVAVGADLCTLQRVLETGKAARGPGQPEGRSLTVSELSAMRESAARESAARQAVLQRAGESAGAVEQVVTEADRRLGSSSALQEIVSGLVKLNLEGMERVESQMRSMREEMADLRKGKEEKQRTVGDAGHRGSAQGQGGEAA